MFWKSLKKLWNKKGNSEWVCCIAVCSPEHPNIVVKVDNWLCMRLKYYSFVLFPVQKVSKEITWELVFSRQTNFRISGSTSSDQNYWLCKEFMWNANASSVFHHFIIIRAKRSVYGRLLFLNGMSYSNLRGILKVGFLFFGFLL